MVTPFSNPDVIIHNLDVLSKFDPGKENCNKLSYEPKTGKIYEYVPGSWTLSIFTTIWRKATNSFDVNSLEKTFEKAIDILHASYTDTPDDSIRKNAKVIEEKFAASLQGLVKLVGVYKKEKGKEETVRKISNVYKRSIDGYNELPLLVALKPDRTMVLNAFTIETFANAKSRLKPEPRQQITVPDAVKKALNQSGRINLTESIMKDLTKSKAFMNAVKANASKQETVQETPQIEKSVEEKKEAPKKAVDVKTPPPLPRVAKSNPIPISKKEEKKAHSLPPKDADLIKELQSSVLRRRAYLDGTQSAPN